MTDTNLFRQRAKDEIVKLERDTYGREITHADIQIVFMSYSMGFMKATLVVAQNTEDRYYEVSYSPIAAKMFIDTYQKVGMKAVQVNG